MKLTSEPEGIMEIVRFVEHASSGLLVPSGSVLRVPSYAYSNWGIEITPKNERWLYEESKKAYTVEWAPTDSSLNELVGKAAEEAGLGNVNLTLNIHVGKIASKWITSQSRDIWTILDVGGGAGGTTYNFLSSMYYWAKQERIGRTAIELDFVEPSESRIETAKGMLGEVCDKLQELGIKVTINYSPKSDIAFFAENPKQYDVIISVAAIHHNSFTYHLKPLADALRKDGFFVSGDWHNSVWEHPMRVHDLMRSLGASEDTLSRFRGRFDLENTEGFRKIIDSGLTPDEKTANIEIGGFWVSVAKNFSGKGKAPIWFLEGHTPSRRRIQHLSEAGLEIDRRKIHSAFPGIKRLMKADLSPNKPDKSDLVKVIVAIKS